jgi:hypothetical protein
MPLQPMTATVSVFTPTVNAIAMNQLLRLSKRRIAIAYTMVANGVTAGSA